MKGKTLGAIGGIFLATFIGGKQIYNQAVTPENVPPSIQMVDENHMRRFSYKPHGSLFRSATSWHDKIVEDYKKIDGGDFKLVKRTKATYNYPLLDSGNMSISIETEEFEQ